MTDPATPLHYAPNGNFVNGVYAPGADGFNLADVSSVSALNALPPGVKGLVYLGLTNGADANFQATVSAFIGNPNLYGFYIADEPGAGLAANLKAEADWIHANVPGAKTFIVEQNLGSQASPVFAYTPANTDIDLFGLDPYPLNVNLPNNLDYGVIARDVSAAEAAGVPQSKIVPVYQAFGGGGYSDWILPTPAQEEQILSTWGSVVPTPAFDYAYSWGAQDGDTALSNDPALQQIFAAHNGASAAPAAPTIARPANGSTDTTTTKPVISGGGVTGDTVTISIDGTRVGTAPVVNSAWTFTPTSPLSNASHTVTATQAASGGLSSTAATDTFTVKVQAAPAAPTIARPANGSTDTTTTKPVISGGGVTGDTVTISIDGTRVGTAPVVNSAWTFTPTSPLSNASHRVTATQAASGGLSSTAATDTFTVKVRTAPAAPTIARPANGSTDTTTTKPVISGGGVTGDTVTISIDGTRVGTAPVVNSAWTFTPTSPLSNASHTVTATQAASGGLSSTAAADTFTVKVQAAAPAAPTIARPANGSTDTTTTKPVHWSPAIADFASHASGPGLDNFASPSAEFAGFAALLTSETNMGFINQASGAAEGYDHMLLGPNVAVSAGLNADFHFHG